MPADTRSTLKAKHNDGGKQKEKPYPSKEGSENASGSKSSIRDTASKKNCSIRPLSVRRSGLLKNGNYQPPNPSPLRRSERGKSISNPGKSDTSTSLTDATCKSFKRKKSVNELVIEANHAHQHGKTESNASSQGKKSLPARLYRDLFRPHTKKVKASDSASWRRVEPCTSSKSGGCREDIPVADQGDLKEEGIRGVDFAESSTSKSDKGVLDKVLQEVASETTNVQNNLELHTRHNPLNASVEESVTCSKKQRVDVHLPKTNLFQDTCTSSILEVCSEGKIVADMGICQNGAVNLGDTGLQLDSEMECEENKCIICKVTGRLLMCGGKCCRRQCHSACLDSRLEDLYPGIWHCPWCSQKKIKFGVHSVCEGIESILDVRVQTIQNHEGNKAQKEYFAKYKGLAHAHNCWLPEQKILLEAPELVSEFVRRENAIPWRQEWSDPHRLLLKRSLTLPKSEFGVAQEVSSTRHEWLVKWRGLDYNEISWELENAAFLKTPNALDLMNEYESRHQKARRSACSQNVHEIQDKEKDFSVELSTLPSASDTNCTDFIYNLRDYWSKGQNALMIDGKVQAAHIIYFILALQPNVSRPFLVMVPSSSISKWEAEFSFVAPSVNTVVYSGNRDARRMIRTLEFYDGPHVMFTVLLSTLDIITEDTEYIKRINWEAVIMDECLNSKVLAELVFVKELASGSMILLLLDQENAIDYYNVLSLLDHNSDSCDVEGRQADPESITLLREKLSPFIVCGPKSVPSRLVEYWVPVQMSNVQLELYCSSLLTNSTALCSKGDPVGLLGEILVSTRKCCDHPYVVEEKLQARLIQGSPPADILGIGIEASGKLYYLDIILTMIKDQGKKVIILFKTLGGSGRDIIGDILDDYVRQRFGKECYERVDAGGVSSRRQASVARFNKEGRFIFLLETRACSSSIKLSSVDAVIIFGSDWNPLNDLKALQKIKIDSKFEVKVFRLYTLCSLEEKVLLLSKKGISLESNLKGLGFSTSHMLLSWGASFLFKKLDEFHDSPGDPKILPQCSVLKNVGQEFLSVLQTHGTRLSTKCIANARQTDGGYSTDIPLLGELHSQFKDEDQHRLLWTKLLEGRQPTWIYLSLSSQRNRKRVQHYGETFETNGHIDDTGKRQKKNGNTNLEPCSPRVIKDVEKEHVSGIAGSYGIAGKKGPELSPKSGCSIASAEKINAANSSDKLCAEQKDLHQVLKPDMERLFRILNLKEDVQKKAEQFLVYIIANQRVIRESNQLQAFLISVCWVAASILKENLDHVESLSLAREFLSFNCKIDDAEFSFSKMQFPMKMFLRSEGAKLKGSSKDRATGTEGFSVSNHKKKLVHEGFDIGGGEKKSKYINKVKGSVAELLNRQTSEENKLKILWYESKAKLEKKFKLEYAVICSVNSTEAVRIDKLKILEANHKKKLEELESELDSHLNSMKEKHRDDPLSAENPSLQQVTDANEESTAVRVEQQDEASNRSVVVPVSQEHATPRGRLNNEDVCAEMSRNVLLSSDHSDGMHCNTSEQAVCIRLPPDSTSPAVSHPNILLTEESNIPCRTGDAPIPEDHGPLDRSTVASPRPIPDAYPPLHNSNQFQSHMPWRSLPSSGLRASQEFDPLRKEYERVCGEWNQVTRNHEDMVLRLKSECEKEIEELVGKIERKYEWMVDEAEASFMEKRRELEENELKVAMNIRLAEAFCCKCMDHRKRVGSGVTQQQQQQQQLVFGASSENGNESSIMIERSSSEGVGNEICLAAVMTSTSSTLSSSVAPNSNSNSNSNSNYAAFRSAAQPPQTSIADQSASTRSAAAAAAPPPMLLLPPLPEIARNFEAWNFTDFEASLDVTGHAQQHASPTGVVFLPQDH